MKQFQPSINIQYDAGNLNIFDYYVPNIKQLDIIAEIFKSIDNENQHSHLIMGPYGAGKSLVAAILSSLLNNELKEKQLQHFLNDIQTVSPETYLQIVDSKSNLKKNWITIHIVGKSGVFEDIILENVQKQLSEFGIEVNLKNDSSYMLELIQIWKEQYSDVYKRLLNVLKDKLIAIKDFEQDLLNNDTAAIAIFKTIYPIIMAGTTFFNPNKLPFSEQISYIYEQLNEQNIGMFIIFDEFGRFLQSVYTERISETMQQIQDLAELTSRLNNAGTLFITHTSLDQYLKSNLNYKKEELERVQKRFVEHHLDSDSDIFYRSAYKFFNSGINMKRNLFFINESEDIKYNIYKYNLFPNMVPEEIEGTIIEGCQPIHPLTIKLLPALSTLLGQNDRTMYSFLYSFKDLGVTDEWYYVDALFDYFYPDESILLTLDTLKFYRLAISYNVSTLALRVIKLATILNITNNRFSFDKEFINFALGVNEYDAEESLEELKAIKLIRFNSILKSYELYEGSLLNVNDLIEEMRAKVLIKDVQRLEAISKIVDEYFVIPQQYNIDKSMTRFVEVQINFEPSPNFETNNDGILQLIMPRDSFHRLELVKSIQPELGVIYGLLMNIAYDDIGDKLDEFIILQNILLDSEFLKQEQNLEEEVTILIESIEYEIKGLLANIKLFKTEEIQYFTSEVVLEGVNSKRDLEIKFSEWMYQRYPFTPEVRNENFNKFNITGIQKKSAIQLLNEILSSEFDGAFEVSGNGPDYLIYATTYKNLEFDFINLENQKNEQYVELRKALLQFLNENDSGSILDIFTVAMKEPFGIRPPLVPLMVIPLIRDRWNSMTFYAKDFHVPKLTSELIYDIIENEINFYTYEVYELTEKETKLLKELNEVFFNNELTLDPHNIFKHLNTWLMNLPRITQITSRHEDVIQDFTRSIRASESDPFKSLKSLVELSLNKDSLIRFKETLEMFVLVFEEQVINDTFAILGISINANLEQIEASLGEELKNSPKLRSIVSALKEETWKEKMILEIVGIKIENWSDVTFDSYIATLNQLMADQSDSKVKILLDDKVISTVTEMDLSIKGKAIHQQIERLVKSTGRTMNSEEIKYILFKILSDVE